MVAVFTVVLAIAEVFTAMYIINASVKVYREIEELDKLMGEHRGRHQK